MMNKRGDILGGGMREAATRRRRKLVACRLLTVVAAVAGAMAYWSVGRVPLVSVQMPAGQFSRRAGDLTVNVCGALSPLARQARYQVNGGQWHGIQSEPPRNSAPFFTLDVDSGELRSGVNQLVIEATGYGQFRPSVTRIPFSYDPSPIRLPIVLDWKNRYVEVEDGYWETYDARGEWRARPTPGYEGYDRIAMVSGAFTSGRRVRVEIMFHRRVGGKPFGFGVMPLWGGRPGVCRDGSRHGWLYGIAWYCTGQRGIGNQFSRKVGTASAAYRDYYRSFSPRRGTQYVVLAEAWPRSDASGRPAGYHQRMKLWAKGEPEPAEWIELSCKEGEPLPNGEYAVALIAHRCRVDFGPVLVEPLSTTYTRE